MKLKCGCWVSDIMREITEACDEHNAGRIADAVSEASDKLRDEFAKAALIGMLANPELLQAVTREEIKGGTADSIVARYSYRYADAMLKEREKS